LTYTGRGLFVSDVVVVVVLAAVAVVDDTVGTVQLPLNLLVARVALLFVNVDGGGSSQVDIEADDVLFAAGYDTDSMLLLDILKLLLSLLRLYEFLRLAWPLIVGKS
jgi:hypothetical protein